MGASDSRSLGDPTHDPPAEDGDRLLEREAELQALDEAIHSAMAGHGRLVMIEGTAGIGKSSLIGKARHGATNGGMATVYAQGSLLERDFSFGLVRQLFEPVLSAASDSQRQRLFAGAGALAQPVVAYSESKADAAPPTQQSTAVHGLYWLTANLAEEAPVAILVDDLHWADSPSLRFLAYLVRRLEGMAVAVVVAMRTGSPPIDPAALAEMMAVSHIDLIRPNSLSLDGVAQLISDRLGATPDRQFVEACRAATGGVPFLVRELINLLGADRVAPTSEAAARVGQIGPRTVARATMLRMSDLPTPAGAVVHAVAVLGRQARLDRVTALAGIGAGEARTAVDRLLALQILAPGPPLCFSHPLVRQAIYEDLPTIERSHAHHRTALLLAAEPAPLDEVAAHLLPAQPMGQREVVDILRQAARQALSRGAPQSAIAYLRRAGEEGAGVPDQVLLLQELGTAEAMAGDQRAIEHLEHARQLSNDPSVRGRIAYQLGQLYLMLLGDWSAGFRLFGTALEELGDREPDLIARMEAFRSAGQFYDPSYVSEFDASLPHLRRLVQQGGPSVRPLALILAAAGALRGLEHSEVVALVEQGLDGGRLLRDEGPEPLFMQQAVVALTGIDELDGAESTANAIVDEALRRGSVIGFAIGTYCQVVVEGRRGDLKDAETHLRSVVDTCLEHGLMFGLPSALCAGLDVLLERPELDDVVGVVESLELQPAMARTIQGALLRLVRGRLLYRRGRRAAAVTDLRAAGKILTSLRFRNQFPCRWRSPLARALGPEATDQARTLLEDELADARALGLLRDEGVALREAGCLEGGARGIQLLEQSMELLQQPATRLERARTLVELGGALRRANRRQAAREPLREGMELAHRCGASRLAERALQELHAAGARPRRPVVSGPDSLTSREGLVARMAAEGMSNREIAQRLFVTSKTVESQLGSAYRKLGVHSRDQLREALSTSE